MNLNQLQCFRTLAKVQHYSRASEQLDVAQPSLSRMMAQLEAELGAKLFERQGRNVVLTNFGNMFYEHIERGLQEIDLGVEAIREQFDPKCGVVNFGFIYALSPSFIPHVIRTYNETEEGRALQFRFFQAGSLRIVEKLKSGYFDLGICSHLPEEHEIDFYPLVQQEYVLVVSKDHPLAGRTSVTLKEAVAYEMILPLDKTNYIENILKAAGLVARSRSRVEEDHAAAALVSINMGIAILPRNRILDYYGICQIPFSPAPIIRTFYLATAKNHFLSPAAKKFYLFLRNGEYGTLPEA